MDAGALSVRELKQELSRRKIDYSGCTEKSELVRLLQDAPPSAAPPPPSSAAPCGLSDSVLSRLSNLLDTLPASLTLLDKKWTETRQEKVRGQLRSVKELLDQSATQGAQLPGWQTRMAEYNQLARDFKRIRDLPRSMNG